MSKKKKKNQHPSQPKPETEIKDTEKELDSEEMTSTESETVKEATEETKTEITEPAAEEETAEASTDDASSEENTSDAEPEAEEAPKADDETKEETSEPESEKTDDSSEDKDKKDSEDESEPENKAEPEKKKESRSIPVNIGEVSDIVPSLIDGLLFRDERALRFAGILPAAAVTAAASSALGYGVTTLCVMLLSAAAISALSGLIPEKFRLLVKAVIVALFACIAENVVRSAAPGIAAALGIFLPLIAVSGIIYEAAAQPEKRAVLPSVMYAVGSGIGYIIILLATSALREIFGSGTFFGASVLPDSFRRLPFMLTAAGAYITVGIVTGIYAAVCNIFIGEKSDKPVKKEKPKPDPKPDGDGKPEVKEEPEDVTDEMDEIEALGIEDELDEQIALAEELLKDLDGDIIGDGKEDGDGSDA